MFFQTLIKHHNLRFDPARFLKFLVLHHILYSHFSNPTCIQRSLFEATDQESFKQDTNLMQVIDGLNSYQTQIYYASQYPAGSSPIQKKMVSPKYTTNWWDLPTTK